MSEREKAIFIVGFMVGSAVELSQGEAAVDGQSAEWIVKLGISRDAMKQLVVECQGVFEELNKANAH